MQSELKIVRIPILPFGLVNAHLIIGGAGCILVDCGLPGSELKVAKVLQRYGFSFKDIKLIIVTHAHVDHAGSAKLLRDLSHAPILAHADDMKHFSQESAMTFCATGWFGRLFLKTSLMFEPYLGFQPDIILHKDDTVDLRDYGIPGKIRHTPGHTAGSISVEFESKDVLVGDLIASGILLGGLIRTNHAKRPPFEDDPLAVALALQRLIDAGMQRFYMGHGGPLRTSEVQNHVHFLKKLTLA